MIKIFTICNFYTFLFLELFFLINFVKKKDMKQLFRTVLIVFILFPQEMFGNPGRFFGDILSKTVGLTRRPSPEEKIFIDLHKIEERLGFDQLELDAAYPLLISDVRNLDYGRFAPLKNRQIRKAFKSEDTEAFKVALFQYIVDNKWILNSPIFPRWWNVSEDFREFIFPHIKNPYLLVTRDNNPNVLLKWWDEAKLRGKTDWLEAFVETSFRNTRVSYNAFNRPYYNDDFVVTVFKAIRESDDFNREIQHILQNNPTIKLPDLSPRRSTVPVVHPE